MRIARLFGQHVEVSPQWGLAFELIQFEEHASLMAHFIFGKIFIPLPAHFHRDPVDCMCDSYGFSWRWDDGLRAALHLNWRDKCKIVYMPWAWEHYRTDYLMADGSWYRKKQGEWERPEGRFTECHGYTYTLKDGQVQHRKATITVDEMEWRWRALYWLPFPRKVRRTIDVRFDDEVGERTGSWKGGVVGCGYEMKKGETPLDTLRRMERDRKFT